MQLQARQIRGSSTKPLPLHWRRCAILLLFMFVWDLGFEVFAPLHFDHEHSAAVGIGAAGTEQHPDCGLPDHGCAISHHHHFPALLSAQHSIVLSVATEHLPGTLPVLAHHRPSTARLIRGPPPLLPLQIFA